MELQCLSANLMLADIAGVAPAVAMTDFVAANLVGSHAPFA
jgi:hypothetical protein